MLFLFSLDLDINYICNLLRMHKWWCILHIERYVYVYVCKMSRHWYIRRYIRTKIMSRCCMHLRTYLKLHICVLYIWMPKLCINTVFKVLFNSLNSFLKFRYTNPLLKWQNNGKLILENKMYPMIVIMALAYTVFSQMFYKTNKTFILIWAVLRMF